MKKKKVLLNENYILILIVAILVCFFMFKTCRKPAISTKPIVTPYYPDLAVMKGTDGIRIIRRNLGWYVSDEYSDLLKIDAGLTDDEVEFIKSIKIDEQQKQQLIRSEEEIKSQLRVRYISKPKAEGELKSVQGQYQDISSHTIEEVEAKLGREKTELLVEWLSEWELVGVVQPLSQNSQDAALPILVQEKTRRLAGNSNFIGEEKLKLIKKMVGERLNLSLALRRRIHFYNARTEGGPYTQEKAEMLKKYLADIRSVGDELNRALSQADKEQIRKIEPIRAKVLYGIN